jgi:hypothetical protein
MGRGEFVQFKIGQLFFNTSKVVIIPRAPTCVVTKALELTRIFAVNQIDTCEKGNRLQTDLPLLFWLEKLILSW